MKLTITNDGTVAQYVTIVFRATTRAVTSTNVVIMPGKAYSEELSGQVTVTVNQAVQIAS